MSSIGRRVALSSAVAIAFAASATFTPACSKPQPPQLTPKEATVTSVDLSGFDMRVKMEAFNPNGYDVSVRTVVAHVIVDATQDLGIVTSSQPINLPANARTLIEVPIKVTWKSAGGLASIAASNRPVPYTVDGTATVGGERLNVDVPFKMQGTLSPEQLQQAGLKSLQNLREMKLPAGLVPK